MGIFPEDRRAKVWPVRFDDRLRTVLAQPAQSPHERAMRWRQLVELAARFPADGDRDLFAGAISEIRDGCADVDERVRMAAALAVATAPLPVELVATFATDRLNVAAPVLAAARLTASEWKTVAAAASEECRALIAAMRSEQPAPTPPHSSPPAKDRDEPGSIPSISDVVARIERLRQSRETSAPAATGDHETAEEPRLFRWECNESGEIQWVEGAPRGALVGQSIAQGGLAGAVDRTVERAFASRAPFHGGVLEIPADVAIGGSWTISGVPAFERASGRFAGYRGLAERSGRAGPPSAAEGATETDSLRELAHEIKTPLNAIIGFAEIITGEYLGPADGRYRERAGEIVAQARLLLSAIEDLDLAARLRTLVDSEAASTNLGALVESAAAPLRELASARGVALDASRTVGELTVAVQSDVAERLITRLCAAVIERARDGEALRLRVDKAGHHCRVSISRPAALQGLSDDQLFGSSHSDIGDGFSLRLARGLARAAGADLVSCPDSLALILPRA